MDSHNIKKPFDHLHYHHHYYYPFRFQRSPQKEINDTLSRSVIYEKRRQSSFQFTPEPTKTKMQTEASQTVSDKKWPKMRLSQVLNKKGLDGERFHSQQSNIKARSVVEQQVQQIEEERESGKSTLVTGVHKQEITVNYRQNVQKSLVAYYQDQLKKYRSELERLKMVEEECVYLRDTFYNHYETRCKRNN